MDKKNTTIGILLLIGAFAGMIWFRQKPAPQPAAPVPALTQPTAEGSTPASAQPAPTAQAPAITPPIANGFYALPSAAPAEAQVVTLANAELRVTFTDFGGAIRDVAFLKHPAVKGDPAPYVFNAVHAAPMLSFTGVPGLDAAAKWEIVEKTADLVTFRAVADGRLEVTRTFALPQPGQPGDPYRVEVSTTVRNLSDAAIGAQRLSLNLGTATLADRHDTGMYLNAAFWDGEDTEYVDRGALEGGGFFKRLFGGDVAPRPYLEKPGKVVWGAVKNQFFAAIFTPDQPGTGLVVRRVKVQPALPDVPTAFGITSDFNFDLPRLEPGASVSLGGKFYVGPKEYARLKTFEQGEHHAMQFDGYFFNRIFFAGFFAPLLLTLLNWFHGFLGNWGWAIVVTTLLLKTVTLPLTLSAAKSSKRMAKIQPRLKEINEKYADNPQKKQKATLELFKEAKVNPVGGCLPILITMPFFIGFFAMLQTSSDLRFAEWFWIKDLASPDTVARIYGFPLNIMPILMGVSSIVQMQLMPTPSMDNAQAKMMKFMPIMFVIFCYGFGSGLALYWTVSNLFTIGQQLIINRMPDHDPLPPAGKSGVKNVTPAGRRPKQK